MHRAVLALMTLGLAICPPACLDVGPEAPRFACEHDAVCLDDHSCRWSVSDQANVCLPWPTADLCADLVSDPPLGGPHPAARCIAQHAYPFAIQRFEVTEADFAVWLNQQGHDPDSRPSFAALTTDSGSYEPRDGVGTTAMTGVDWETAVAYCQSQGSGDLCAEAEWRTAAGSEAWPWGDTAPGCDHAVTSDCHAGPQAVGSAFRAQGEALSGPRDLLGNAAEWGKDCWSSPYEAPAFGGASTLGDCSQRVVLGGSAKTAVAQAIASGLFGLRQGRERSRTDDDDQHVGWRCCWR